MILVRVGLTTIELLTLVQCWLEWRGFAQPTDHAVCWCGADIAIPELGSPTGAL